jgi:hypothetical protein
MNPNSYYSKYLKYKMKYLHEKQIQMQIGGREYDLTITFGVGSKSKSPIVLRVDENTPIAVLKSRIPGYNTSYGNPNKLLFEFTGRVRLDTDPKIDYRVHHHIMVKYEYDIHILIDEDHHSILVLNTDGIKTIYDKLKESYIRKGTKFVITFNETIIDIKDQRTLEEIGIVPGCGYHLSDCRLRVNVL